jgi:hypothetical protein
VTDDDDAEILKWIADTEAELQRWQAKLAWLKEQLKHRRELRREEQVHQDALTAWEPETGDRLQ